MVIFVADSSVINNEDNNMVVVVLIVVFILIIGLVVSGQEKTEIDTVKSNSENIPGFIHSKVIDGYHSLYKVMIDEYNKKVAYVTKDNTITFSFDEILSVELIENGVTVNKKSAGRTIGGAIVGGVLAGGVGMIIGGLSGGSKETKKITSIVVKIVLRNLSQPSINIECYNSYSMLSSDFYKEAKVARDIVDIFNIIIDQVERTPDVIVNNNYYNDSVIGNQKDKQITSKEEKLIENREERDNNYVQYLEGTITEEEYYERRNQLS